MVNADPNKSIIEAVEERLNFDESNIQTLNREIDTII